LFPTPVVELLNKLLVDTNVDLRIIRHWDIAINLRLMLAI
jgi:hypothetical protein